MLNIKLYESFGATSAPLTSTLLSIDGSLVRAVGLAALLIGGVLLSAAVRRWRVNRRLATGSVVRLSPSEVRCHVGR